MCIEFQHLGCQVVVIKGMAYLLTHFIAAKMTRNSKTGLTLSFTAKITFAFLALVLYVSGLGLGLVKTHASTLSKRASPVVSSPTHVANEVLKVCSLEISQRISLWKANEWGYGPKRLKYSLIN